MKPIHRKRLKRLAEYLLTQVPGEKFDMEVYRKNDERKYICGTAGCALGWSPAIMAPSTFWRYKTEFKDANELFPNISIKYFGIDGEAEDTLIWEYLFSSLWAYADNTPQGAAARILYFLEHGVPDSFNWDKNSYDWDISHYQKHLTTGA